MQRNFKAMLEVLWALGRFVCVGLDSEYKKIPAAAHRDSIRETMLNFNQRIVDATKDLVCAYKLQIAFYEAQGAVGIIAMMETVLYIWRVAPTVPIIVDAKCGDIESTNEAYAEAIFDTYGFDAATFNPYLGIGALKPFLDRKDKGIIILCRTSNPDAREFQDLFTIPMDPRKKPQGQSAEDWLELICDTSMPLYQRVAINVGGDWNQNGNCFLVVGATYPEEGGIVRGIVGDHVPFLVPGAGKQGGEVEAMVLQDLDMRKKGIIVNSSRGIIFASSGPDFAEAARRETLKLHEQISAARAKKGDAA